MDNKTLLDNLYTELYNAVSPSVDGQPPSSLLCMFTVARTVGESTDISELADSIPAVNKGYVATANKVSSAYGLALSAQFPTAAQPHTAEETARYNAAKATLYTDHDGLIATPKFAAYKTRKSAWEKALWKLHRAMNKSGTDKDDIADLQDIVNDKADELREVSKEIEDALNAYQNYFAASPNQFMDVLREKYKELSGKYPITTDPTDWQAAEKIRWTSVDVKVSSSDTKIHSDIREVANSFTSSYENGFWFFASGASDSSQEYDKSTNVNSDSVTQNLSVSLELAEIELNRQWLDTSFFAFDKSYIATQKAGAITTGTLADTDRAAMPLIPVSLVLVRNVEIYGDFNESVYTFVEQMKSYSDNRSTCFGPFKSNSSKVGHSNTSDWLDDEQKDNPASAKIEMLDVQLIGVRCAITTPKFPACDG
jgi:hypothetical protein